MQTIQEIKVNQLSSIFAEPERIAEYGSLPEGASAITELSDLMERSPVTRLAEMIENIVSSLKDADPKKLAKPQTFWEKALSPGKALETRVRYKIAREAIDELMLKAAGAAQGVRDAVASMDRLIKSHTNEAKYLENAIAAGQEYLAENPEAGKPNSSALEFDNNRERFARRLANLSTLLSSHTLSVAQMKLTRAQAVDMLDQFSQTTQVLMPVWRQNTLTLTTQKNMSPEMLAKANKAHEDLMLSLTNGMKPSS